MWVRVLVGLSDQIASSNALRSLVAVSGMDNCFAFSLRPRTQGTLVWCLEGTEMVQTEPHQCQWLCCLPLGWRLLESLAGNHCPHCDILACCEYIHAVYKGVQTTLVYCVLYHQLLQYVGVLVGNPLELEEHTDHPVQWYVLCIA